MVNYFSSVRYKRTMDNELLYRCKKCLKYFDKSSININGTSFVCKHCLKVFNNTNNKNRKQRVSNILNSLRKDF